MPRAPKAPARPKAAQRHPLPHQRLSEETLGTPQWGFQPAVAPPLMCVSVEVDLASWAFARETLAYFCGEYLQY